MNTKIYVGYYADAFHLKNEIIEPIQLGRALATSEFEMIGDNTGDNISHLNPFLNELTALYWAWKNDKTSDYIGFFHYRRMLDFKVGSNRKEDIHGLVVESQFHEGFVEEYGLSPESIRDLAAQYDILLPKRYEIPHSLSLQRQYEAAAGHHAKDYLLTGKVVNELYPQDYQYFQEVSRDYFLYATNIFVMRRELFDEYCAWLFPLLFRLHELIDVSSYTVQEQRAVGYLAERLFTVYLHKLAVERPELKRLELQRVFVRDTQAKRNKAIPATPRPNSVTLVASTNQAYVPQMCALLVSIAENANPDRPLDILILQGGLTTAQMRSISSCVASQQNFRLYFYDMSQEFLDVKLHYYFPASTLYRLDLPNILPDHDKVLFLDTDMVCAGDVCQLFDIDLKDAMIAAVSDLVINAFCAMDVKSNVETGSLQTTRYLSEKLGIEQDKNPYFQAGVLLFNLKAFREMHLPAQMISNVKSERFWFLDQDVLNKYCRGHVHYLDNSWNTVFMDEHHLAHLGPSDLSKFHQSLKNPQIVHFAGVGKPWHNDSHPLAQLFWKYLRKTEWYEFMIFKRARNEIALGGAPQKPTRGRLYRTAAFTWHLLPEGLRMQPASRAFIKALKRVKRSLFQAHA